MHCNGCNCLTFLHCVFSHYLMRNMIPYNQKLKSWQWKRSQFGFANMHLLACIKEVSWNWSKQIWEQYLHNPKIWEQYLHNPKICWFTTSSKPLMMSFESCETSTRKTEKLVHWPPCGKPVRVRVCRDTNNEITF